MGPFLHLIFPAWKLFDQPGDQFEISYRLLGKDIQGHWQKVERKAYHRGLRSLFFNSFDTKWLFFWSLCDDLCLSISQDQKIDWNLGKANLQIRQFLETELIQRKTKYQIYVKITDDAGNLIAEHFSEVLEC